MAGPDNDNTTGDVVRLTQGEWERRAAVAEEAAALLAGAADRVLVISKNNKFGECVEGEGMHSALMSALHTIQETWTAQAAAAQIIATSCTSASETLTAADLESRSSFDF